MSEILSQTQLAKQCQLGLETLTSQHTHTGDSNNNAATEIWGHLLCRSR